MLDVTLLEKNLKPLRIIDTYTDFIWTERFGGAGDFQLTLPTSMEMIEDLIPGRYMHIAESNKLMVIETVELYSNATSGHLMTIAGRSLESILSYRIVWTKTTLDGTLESGIQTLLNENIISPSNSARRVANLIFEPCGDAEIAEFTLVGQYTGENLYDVISQICEAYEIGFEIFLNDNNQFVFRLVKGTDRSYSQYENSPVVFSPRFDNLLDSKYRMDAVDFKTSAFVVAEVNGSTTSTEAIYVEAEGLDRRELYVEASDVEQTSGMSNDKFLQLLRQRGIEELYEYQIRQDFDCSIDTHIGPRFGVDYYIGDIVQVEDDNGIQSQCRVSELIRSVKPSGYYEYPAFTLL